MSLDAPGFETGATATRPRAVVFAVMPSSHGEPGEEQPLDEIKELLRSADIDWLADVVQRRATPSARSYLGKGKMEDLKTMVQETGATVAVCEDDLTPAQVAAVLDVVDVDVLDRTELILTVFSRHAHSLEGTLQVHLAQLEYELTRMRGKGLILSRLGAGVDMRGPGETKLEVDRRVVRKRIQTLRARIDHLAKTRRTQRARRLRSAVPLIALAGYTNSGKSTLLNALTDADVSVRDRLFETLDPTSRSYRYRDRDYVLTDTVGFIRKLPHHLVDAFRSTLEEVAQADVVVHVVDVSDPESGRQMEIVESLLTELGAAALPRLTVYNKADRVDLLPAAAKTGGSTFVVSALTGEGLDALRGAIESLAPGGLVPVHLLLPYDKAGMVDWLHGHGRGIATVYGEDGIDVRGSLREDCLPDVAPWRVEGRGE